MLSIDCHTLFNRKDPPFSLVEYHCHNFPSQGGVGDELGQQAALDIAPYDHNATVRLEPDRHQVSGLVDGKVTRYAPAGRERLQM